jgi:hypothetical protein
LRAATAGYQLLVGQPPEFPVVPRVQVRETTPEVLVIVKVSLVVGDSVVTE